MIDRRKFIKTSLLSLGALPFMGAAGTSIKNSYLNKPDDAGMKRLGLIGGTSWHSTIDYYRYINQMVNDIKGDRINPPLLIFNLNQFQINTLQSEDKWSEIADIYTATANDLIKAGAEGFVLCSNTAHAIYETLTKRINVPVLHIADATALEAERLGLKELGLLGTRYTMEKKYIKDRFTEKYNLKIVTPDKDSRMELARIIQDELSAGKIKENSKKYILGTMDKLKSDGAQGMILGCTEIPEIIKQKDYSLPVFDTTYLHSKMAVAFMLGKL
jgi:aspartate racemase